MANQHRPRIGVDIDGVVADLVSALLPRLVKRFDKVFTPADIIEYSIPSALGLDPVEFADFWNEVELELYATCTPYPGAVEGLMSLTQIGDVHLETARPSRASAITSRWANEHLGTGFIVEHYDDDAKFHPHRRFDFIIDDQLDVANARARGSTVCLLVNRPWNRAGGHPNLLRVDGLPEAAKIIRTT